MFLRWIMILATAMFFTTCQGKHQIPQGKPSERQIIAVSENRKYGISCIFYGEEQEWREGQHVKLILDMAIRENSTGREILYIKDDYFWYGDFVDVWSPDEEYLVIPKPDPVEGFCIIKSAVAFETIEKKNCPDFIRVLHISDTLPPMALWHRFMKWDGDDSFVFTAGISGGNVPVRYNITTGKLVYMDTQNTLNDGEGESTRGRLRIEKNVK